MRMRAGYGCMSAASKLCVPASSVPTDTDGDFPRNRTRSNRARCGAQKNAALRLPALQMMRMSKSLLQVWLAVAASSAYRYAATPPPITADQVISDDFGGAFCGDEDGGGCTVRAPGAKAPLVTRVLRNASDVETYARQRPGVRNPVLWVPLRHATSQGAFEGLCAFATRLVPMLAKANDVAGFTLLTLPYPVGEHG